MIELPTEGDCPLHAECHGAGFECARCRLALVRAENERLREALSIIAGYKQCVDNLLGNREIAITALKEVE